MQLLQYSICFYLHILKHEADCGFRCEYQSRGPVDVFALLPFATILGHAMEIIGHNYFWQQF